MGKLTEILNSYFDTNWVKKHLKIDFKKDRIDKLIEIISKI
jgi:hypothetical protein